ncbi:MAG: hypothetical protein JRH08_14225 [Deltaproteobacteria bacterium]|nr:hypothetical protein [Deltaproteobacteria bacterium]MBW1928626.1 hypothetical protein [Deltaproteobacteria bacterium]MBW2024687.1 hypothetical protein [Deltaproteobacteria bacterium]MBW2126797.1 hypothetical protein [Deltaproteobacteria bacterium]RLB14606.1 MAG: hypothetical protein DRG63_08230 [Deltaproteobacteria bacterium]
MPIPGNLLTTAMAVMPHTDVDRALEVALSTDIPFWPQLPLYSYYEDMYVQASEHFPGIVLDLEKRTLRFSMEKFIAEAEEAMAHFDDPEYFDISTTYSVVYHRFLHMDLSDRPAIRGQLEGPISFGLNIVDQDDRPILFDDTVRPFMFEFMAKRINVQLERLKKRNPNAFMFVDEPGLQFLFSAMSGYNDISAHAEMEMFFSMIDRPRGIHLCGNPDWDFLLSLDLDILSLDVYSNGEVFANYAASIKRFLDRGGILVWGMVPTNFEPFEKEDMDSLEQRLEEIWSKLAAKGIDTEFMVSKSLLSPATCCLVNPDKEKTVEKAFEMIGKLSARLREKHRL